MGVGVIRIIRCLMTKGKKQNTEVRLGNDHRDYLRREILFVRGLKSGQEVYVESLKISNFKVYLSPDASTQGKTDFNLNLLI